MENIVRLTPAVILDLCVVMTEADLKGKSVRVCTGTDENGPWFKYDNGSGWTPPLYGLDW